MLNAKQNQVYVECYINYGDMIARMQKM